MDAIHRILSGQSLTQKQLIGAGCFVGFWFLIDLIQFVDFTIEKISKLL